MKKAFISILLLLNIFTAFSQEYSISGNAATYSGQTLKIYTFSDYITKYKQIISECSVSETGNFVFKLTEKDTLQAYIDLDVFIGKIIIEPGENLEIVLPKKTVRSEYDRLNPYFKPREFYIRILSDDNNITAGIKHFNKLYNKSVDLIFKEKSYINSGVVEKEIIKINDSTSYLSNSFFNNYKKYKFLYLRHLSFYKNKNAIIRKNFSEEKLLYQNPAYNEMLEKSFRTFIFETQGDTLYSFLSSNYSWRAYSNYLAKDEMFYNKEFREYILLLNLYKLFYKNNAYQKNIIKLLHSAKNENVKDKTKKIIDSFLNKVGKLTLGNPVADFSLPDETGFEISLSEFRDKFVYLCFFDKNSYTCQKDIELINKLNKKNIELLEIITIFKDEDSDYIAELKEKNDYEWTFLQCDKNNRILEDYKVVAYPTYYLIHPKGTLSLLPAPGPAENFEPKYFKISQIWKRKLIRNESKNY